MRSIFNGTDVVGIIGISYKQLQYWDKTNFIKPSAIHMGRYRKYTFADLVLMQVTKLMREQDVSIQRLRKVIQALEDLLPKVGYPLSELSFLISGVRVLVFNGDVLMNKGAPGEFFFQVKSLRDKVDKQFPDVAE